MYNVYLCLRTGNFPDDVYTFFSVIIFIKNNIYFYIQCINYTYDVPTRINCRNLINHIHFTIKSTIKNQSEFFLLFSATCSSLRDPCVDDPCLNGTCIPHGTFYRQCDCYDGFTGLNCETNIGETTLI